MADDVIFQPLKFRNLTVKNRIFRSNIAGRLDNYDGSGNQARINWEVKFARGGVGAIISSFVPVHINGRIMPNYANGSVPTLADLLEKTERRPKLVRRGYDLFDPVRVGFVTAGPEAERIGTVFDTSQPGGGNDGHLYGTELSDTDKTALIEYLKTL